MRLVLCDDNRILCEALAVALEARGHRVLATATTSMLGIAEVARHRPDACLLDLGFPDPPDGLGAARVIRERYPETAVLVLSGLADPAVLSEATQIGRTSSPGRDTSSDSGRSPARDAPWGCGGLPTRPAWTSSWRRFRCPPG